MDESSTTTINIIKMVSFDKKKLCPGLCLICAYAFILFHISHRNSNTLTIGCVYIHNDDNFILETQPVDMTVYENRFQENFGAYVLNLGLSHYSYLNTQKLMMRFNWVQRNVIKEPWLGLNPRSRVAAPVVIASTNVR